MEVRTKRKQLITVESLMELIFISSFRTGELFSTMNITCNYFKVEVDESVIFEVHPYHGWVTA